MYDNIMKYTLIFDMEWFERVHLHKDVGMIPSLLNKLHNVDASILFYENEKNNDIQDMELGINMVKIQRKINNNLIKKFQLPILKYLLKNAKEIDVLMLFHRRSINFLYSFLYKLINPKGKVYLKLDMGNRGIDFFDEISQKGASLHQKILFLVFKIGFKKMDLVTIETQYGYAKMHDLFGDVFENNLLKLPNGFFLESNQNIKKFDEKENLIITVGRIGAKVKNHKMILDALSKVEFRNWKAVFIGSIDDNFRDEIEQFYCSNEALKNKVVFTGEISDKNQLYDWYNRSKIFCLTSDYEGFPLVFTEALYFGNYIISTNIDAANDITKNGELGYILGTRTSDELSEKLQSIIDDDTNIHTFYDDIIKHSKENFLWEALIKNLYNRLL